MSIQTPLEQCSQWKLVSFSITDHSLACRAVARGNKTAFALWATACQPSLRFASEGWWSQTGSNRRPEACKATALPAELWPLTCLIVGPPSPRLPPTRRAKAPLRRDSLFALPGSPSHSLQSRRRLVGLGRFELPTSRLSSARSNQLSYRPFKRVSVMKKEKRRRRCPAL